MTRHRRGPARRRRSPEQYRRILRVHTEGERTEPDYLAIWGSLHRDSVTLNFGKHCHGDPAGLVAHACRDVDDNRRAEKRGEPPYDEIWCVFDRDTHPQIKQTINRAKQKGLNVAFSNPCFELWLVLHRQPHQGYVERRTIQRLAESQRLIRGKAINDDVKPELVESYGQAKERARQLDRMHERNLSEPDSNPSTGVWKLVDSIRQDGSRRA